MPPVPPRPPEPPDVLTSITRALFGKLSNDPQAQALIVGITFLVFTNCLSVFYAWLKTTRLATARNEYKTALDKHLTRRETGVKGDLPQTYEEFYNKVFVLGEPGTGKTTLVRSLTLNVNADPRVKTEKPRIYTFLHETIYANSDFPQSDFAVVTRVDVNDYRGQSLAEALVQFQSVNPQSKAKTWTSLILIIDLFDPPRDNQSLVQPQPNWSEARVRHHVQCWPANQLNAQIDMVRRAGQLRYLCLFVNKLDLLVNANTDHIRAIEEATRPIYDTLLEASSGAICERIIGSTQRGIGVSLLQSRLINPRWNPEG